jgi:hypothetical protein
MALTLTEQGLCINAATRAAARQRSKPMTTSEQRDAIADAALNVYVQSAEDSGDREFTQSADGYGIAFAIGLGCTICIVLAALTAVFWPA